MTDKILTSPTTGEVSFEQAFSTMWMDEAFHDVTLKAMDGTLIPVNRYALAARNVYFRKLFLTDFKEAKDPTVEIGFSGPVLKAVLEYIHTNKADTLFENEVTASPPKKVKTDSIPEETLGKFHFLLNLAESAKYFDLPGFSEQVQECISGHLQRQRALSFLAVGAPSVYEKIRDLAFQKIQENPDECLVGSIVQTLTFPVLEELLKEHKDDLGLSYFHLFKLINLWVSTKDDEHLADAKELLMQQVDLSKISPKELSSSVAASGLVSNEQLLEAYKQQALTAEEEGTKFASFPFLHQVIWKESQSKEFRSTSDKIQTDFVDCKPMTSGVHQWAIKVKGLNGTNLTLGIIAGKNTFRDNMDGSRYIGDSEASWGVAACGNPYGKGKDDSNLFPYRAGDTVTFTLDLRPSNLHNGSLSLMVNGSQPAVRFTNLRQSLSNNGGFFPAASLDESDDAIEILRIGRL